jgi:dihydrofolate reductase
MRQVQYAVAASLDGFIAGPSGEADWIGVDPEFDFSELYSRFDTGVMGSGTFAAFVKGPRATLSGMQVYVCSNSLSQKDYPDVTIVRGNPASLVAELKTKPGKDIWLFGGSKLFRTLVEAGQVDIIEVALIPVLLGDGIPLFWPPYLPTRLTLEAHRVYKSGRVSLTYKIS